MKGDTTRLFTSILTDWAFGSFFGATFDKLFSYIPMSNVFINLIGAITQLTLVSFFVQEGLYATGLRSANQTIQSSFVLWLAIWEMSPIAVNKLKTAYYRFHIFLYGSGLSRNTTPPATDPPAEKQAKKSCCASCK
jgi:hypothetical protein